MNPPLHWQTSGPGVFRDSSPTISVGDMHIAFLDEALKTNANGRVRLCAHDGSDAKVHEMLIALTPESYVRPHRHLGKSESFHMIDGEIDMVLFSPDGDLSAVISLGSFGRGRTFYHRLASDVFHTVLVKAPRAVFHETTSGPFIREETEFANWAPEATSAHDVGAYVQGLNGKVSAWKKLHHS